MPVIAQLILAGMAMALPAAAPPRTGKAVACRYPVPGGDMTRARACGWIDRRGRAHLDPRVLGRIDYDPAGLAPVWLGGWHYVRRDGRTAPVMAYDNGAETFSDGLARSRIGGRIGYIGTDLELAIPAQFDGAFPFEHGRAVVCIGCRPRRYGEHHYYTGGRWGCIDPSGQPLRPLRVLAEGEGGAAMCEPRA
ncbi:MAG: WG repeat-containing protein [Pseudomonadota bacterium]